VHWATLDIPNVARRLQSDVARGLPAEEAAARLARDGANAIPEAPPPGWPRVLMAQFADVMILLLLAAALVAAAIGELRDAGLIVLILVLNAVIGAAQERRATRAVAELKRLVAPTVKVVRDGAEWLVPARELVVGDLALVEAGGRVGADLRLCDVRDLEIDESALTGESVPVAKSPAAIADGDAPIGDRHDMAFSGTLATRGAAHGLVVATGARTELGRIAGLVSEQKPPPTPLQRRLARVSRRLAVAAIAICAVVFAAGVLRGESPLAMLLTATSLAVAAIPEALPAVVTVLLAVGARKMARHNALIRRLPAVETLGSVTYICADKTGTLTENWMRVAEIRAADVDVLLTAMALCNDADHASGEPTERALAEYARAHGFDRPMLERRLPRVATFAFSSARKRMTTVHEGAAGRVAYMKGAPEVLLRDDARWQAAADALARSGLRVLAFARRAGGGDPDAVDGGVEILGLAGLVDPPRTESAGAIAACREAGIVPVMITGDHPETARAIARTIGLADADGVITGRELAALGDAELAARVLGTRVYARVDPSQKIRIVEALQARGQFVAMTGDGVNDAPALARADIGVAMGRGGTDVAREAAGLVLLDDNFVSIVRAIREGRRIFDNIRKFIRYVLTCNLAEVLTILIAPFFGMPLPLLPVQILWINLVTDGLPGLALAAEPAEPEVMRRPPTPPRAGLFDASMWWHIGLAGGFMAALTLVAQHAGLAGGSAAWQTMVFTTLTFLQLGQALVVRAGSRSIVADSPLRNPYLLGAVAVTAALQIAVVYLPVGNLLLHTTPMTLAELALCVAAALAGIAFGEMLKRLSRVKRAAATRA
jgi:Ca2+-transporting ATPase